jgi:alkanesulfonate monooxygenase SsuD/methylene tetrahydromethanopterin reductase-like flavin-dependent oxidoreductase (luciferase family)
MRPLEIGLALPTIGLPMNRGRGRWSELQPIARGAEEVGFDTVWLPDELLWKFPPDFQPMGTWECVAMTSAVAAVTGRVKVGTWVLSALHRNAGLSVKVVEAIDEISNGRFIFGLGAGHSGQQGKAFGYPSDNVISRYEEALQIIVPALREGTVTYSGEYHSAFEQDNTPRSSRGGGVPLMLAGHGPRTIGLAVEYGDIWSGYATEGSTPEFFVDMLRLVDQTCVDRGRDPTTLGKSIGVFVEPTSESLVETIGLGVPLRGSPAELAEAAHQFAEMGVTMLEVIPAPYSDEALDRLAEMIEILDA